eukprot:12034497-Prorocentrum_lima.AAC.1
MTSSLVGSDMCIRDRRSESPRGVDDQRCEFPDFLRNRAQRQRVASVSYTHLTLPTICSV